MRKSIFLSIITVGVLYASPNETSVGTKGLFFGNLSNAKGDAYYGKYNALLGCLHNRGGSDTIGYYDCTELVQVFKGDNNSDSSDFRDNVWCMESNNPNLGNKNEPSKDEFASDIYNNGNVYVFNENNILKYNTKVYKYPNKDYQESYKNLRANTTGRLLVLAKNESDYNPFSFYLTNNISNLNSDFAKFVNNYAGLLNGKMGFYTLPTNFGGKVSLYQGWIGNINMSRAQGGTESHKNGCNYASNGYGGGLKGGDRGCGVSDWNKLNFIEKYVRFYYDLTNNGCSIKPVNYWSDTNFRDDVARDGGIPRYGGIVDNNGKILYYRTPTNATNSQATSDKLFVEEARDFNLGRVINGNEKCRQIIEEMTVKNASTYGTREFGNKSDFLFFNNNNLENGNYFGQDMFSNGIGKCYFVNLQYYDNKGSFPAITANKFLWGNQNRFLQNYLKQDGRYAIANYSIDRKNIYNGNKPGNETSIFTLNTRPTSFRGADKEKYGNTSQGELRVNYNLIFYPDANGSKTTVIDDKLIPRTAKVENLPSSFNEKEFYVVTSLEYGVNNNAQLSFTYQGKDLDPNRLGYANKAECNLDNGQNCGNMKFKFKDFKYNIYKLQKTDGNFKVIGEEKDKTGRFDSEYTTDFMALRVDEGLLNAIDYKDNDAILLELTLDKGYYADDRPFFETKSDSIIEADNAGRFVVIISDIKFSGGNLDFGSIWDKGNSESVPNMTGSNVGFSPGVVNTRVAGNPVFIGIKNSNPKNNLNPNDNFITFEIRDGNGSVIKNPNVSFYENGKNKVNLNHDNDSLVTNPLFNQTGFNGSYPYNNGVLKIDDLKVGKYKVCFTIYSKPQIQEEINKNGSSNSKVNVPVKMSDCSNEFSIRPAYAEYSTNTKFNAGENAKNGGQRANFDVKLIDSKNRLINTNEEFGLTKTNLNVLDSNKTKYSFSLYATNNKKVSNTNEIAFNKQGEGIYTINNVIVNFPFSTNAELELFEGKFTKADSNAMLCNAGLSDNVIDTNGKVGCLIPYKTPLVINFNSLKEYELRAPVINNVYTKEKVFFQSEKGDQNSLKISYVFNNKGLDSANGLQYVYHKFDTDQKLNYDLKFDNKDSQYKDRYLVNIDDLYVGSKKVNIISSEQIKIEDVLLTKEKLNKEFDTKLKELYDSTKASDSNITTTSFEAIKDKISANLDLAYSKYKKATTDNSSIDMNSLLSKPSVAEFSLLSSSTVNENGKNTNLSKDYSFIFTNVTYKDSSVINKNNITLDPSKNLEIYYLNKKAEREKIAIGSPLYSKPAKDIVNELSFNADYGSLITKDATTGDLTVTLTPSYSKKQYIKEVINLANTNDLNGGRFTIEFNNR